MKRKRLLLLTALAGACFQSGSLLAQNQGSRLVPTSSSVGHIGDNVQGVGDRSRNKPALTADARPAEFRANVVDSQLDSTPLGADAPMHFASYQDPVPAPEMSSSYSTGSYNDSVVWEPASSNSMAGVWTEFDTLLWFSGERRAPALVTRNATTGAFPVQGVAGTQIVAGDQTKVGDGLQPGFRMNVGIWLDDQQDLAFTGGAFGLFGRRETTQFPGIGSQSLGIPFFNTSLGIPDAYLLNFDAGGLGQNTGSASVSSRLNLIGAEANLRRALIRSGGNRLDVVGGYLFARLDDQLSLTTSYEDNIANLVLDGTTFDTVDNFRGQNTFHGGQLGLLSQFTTGSLSISTGAKFGLGNMNQTATASGSYLEVGGGGAVADNRGLFVQSSNRGTQTRNVFAFIPQIDLKLGYKLRSDLQFNVGYNLMYFSDVALAGNQIDPNIDIANIFAAPTAPASRFVNDSLLLHGVSLGLNWTF